MVRRKEGRVVNSVIHTLTRDSENERQRIDQTALLDMALRFNPDIIVVGGNEGTGGKCGAGSGTDGSGGRDDDPFHEL